jgi:hypothetical protein
VTSTELENLVRIGSLKREPSSPQEIEGLRRSGEARLKDAGNPTLSLESRFDLGYNAAHALALVALRRAGYRSDKRYIVFQTLAHTLAMPAVTCRLLAKCHTVRNAGEYEGEFDIDERLLEELLTAAMAIREALRRA